MILRGFSIDGYGVFSGWAVENLSRGTTVFLGPNEAGKSTLLSFLVGAMFGYPTGRGQPVALKGGVPGGRLYLEDDRGKRYTLSRYPRKTPELISDNGERCEEAELLELLGHFDAPSYRAVFGFDLTDLEGLKALDEEKVRSRLFSAGLSGAGDAVANAVRWLDADLSALLKARGDSRLKALLSELKEVEAKVKDAQAASQSYAGLQAKRSEAVAGSAELLKTSGEIQAEVERLGALIKAKPAALKVLKAKDELASLRAPEFFPAEGLSTLELLKGRLAQAKAELSTAAASFKELSERAERHKVDERWLEFIPALKAADRERIAREERQKRLAEGAQAADAAREELSRQAVGIGSGWTIERVVKFDSGLERHHLLRKAKDEWQEAAAEVRSAKTLLLEAEARLQELQSKVVEPPPASRLPLIFIAAALLLAALSAALPETARPSAWLAAAGVFSAGLLAWVKAKPAANPEEEHARLLSEAAGEHDRKARRHEEWLERRKRLLSAHQSTVEAWGLSPAEAPDPEAALILLERLLAAARAGTSLQAAEERLEKLQAEDRLWLEKLRGILEATPLGAPAADEALVPALEEALGRALKEEEAQRTSLLLAEKLLERGEALKGLEAGCSEAEKALSELLSSAGAEDENHYRRLYADFRRKEELSREESEGTLFLKGLFGSGEGSVKAMEELMTGAIAEWEEKKRRAEERLGSVGRDYEAANRECGGLDLALRQLETSTLLPELLTRKATLIEEIKRQAKSWREAALARALLSKALEAFAKERQPFVLSKGSGYLEEMTEGRYQRVLQPPGEKEGFRLQRFDGAHLGETELSRGTREELYLSLRLGLAADFARRGANLPLIIDDAFVNFDPARSEKALQAVSGFAAEGQALLFTCHPETARLALKVSPDAKLIRLDVDQGVGRLLSPE